MEQAVQQVLDNGYRTLDLAVDGEGTVTTGEMGTLVAEAISG